MKNVLEELWYGNLSPNDGSRGVSKEMKEIMKSIAYCHDDLYSTLNDEQKKKLEKFSDSYADLSDISERETFVYAFRLGAKIVLEILT